MSEGFKNTSENLCISPEDQRPPVDLYGLFPYKHRKEADLHSLIYKRKKENISFFSTHGNSESTELCSITPLRFSVGRQSLDPHIPTRHGLSGRSTAATHASHHSASS